jgi:hypothetical protein
MQKSEKIEFILNMLVQYGKLTDTFNEQVAREFFNHAIPDDSMVTK